MNKLVALSDRATQIDPNNATAYLAKLYYLFALCYMESQLDCRWNEMIRIANAGLAVDQYSAVLLAARSYAEGQVGRYEERSFDLQKARRLNQDKSDPDISSWDR
jgi:hypothetical protein